MSTVAARPRTGVVRAKRMLLLAVALVLVGAFLPWVDTPIGSFTGMNGAGVWTFYAASLGLAAALVPWPRVALAQATVFGVVSVALPAWQLARLLGLGVGGWAPGIGLVMTLGGGILALRAVARSRA